MQPDTESENRRRQRSSWRSAMIVATLAALVSCTSDRATEPRSAFAPSIPAKQLGLSSAFDQYVFLPFLLDVQGPNDQPAQVDLNGFTRADNVSGKLGVAWTWDDINAWTGTGQTGDACALFDTSNPANGNADYAICVRITNDASGANVFQLNPGSPIIYSCGDNKTDRCSQPNTSVPLGSTRCEVVKTAESFPGQGDDGQDVLAACSIDLSAIGNATKTNILNVCSFPSGAPNSNAFDCIVTPGAGFLRIAKKTTPDASGLIFHFTLNPAASNGTTSYTLTDNAAGDETTALIAVAPGTYSLTETSIPTGWQLTTAACVRGASTSTGTKSGDAVTGIGTTVGETTVCTFENTVAGPSLTVDKTASPTSIPETGGSVTYSVMVTNTSLSSVTLTTLVDDKFGDLNGTGNCATGGTIAASGNYSCSFSKTLPAATAGATHKDTVSATVTNPGGNATARDDAVVTYTDVAPTLTVDKSANPTAVPETGGSVTYTVVVTNTAAEAVTLTTLTDDRFGDLNNQGTCKTGGTIAPSATYTCTFARTISGNAGTSHKNTVSATVTDNDGTSATGTDDATVTFSDVLPAVTVTKTANPTSVPETGGSVTYTVTVKNDALEAATLTTLSDDIFGILNGAGTCSVPQSLAPGATYSCTFSKTVAGNVGTSHVNTVTARLTDNDGNHADGHDDATVTFTNVLPTLTVTKTPSPTTVAETGGSVSFTVVVHNTSAEAVTLTTLSDNVFGDLSGQGSCATGGTIAAGGNSTCSFSKTLSGNAGTTHKDTVTATVTDDENTTASAKAGATVTFTNVNPNISVTKTANPTSISTLASGSLVFTADRTYTTSVSSTSNDFTFATPTCDDAGPNDQPAQVDLNCFNRADNVSGKLGVQWSWDDINSWGGTGQTGDACALIDTDNDGNANVAVCARITNAADGSIVQVGGNGAADVYLCNDTKSDRCAKQVTQVLGAGKGTTTCGVGVVSPDQLAGGDDGADVVATCSIDLAMQGLAGTTSRDLLNVCSFPSGEPNSNPFDCVVKVGAAFVQIVKSTDVTTTQLFGFTMSAASTNGTSKYAVQAGATTELLPVTPGNNYAITETMPSSWSLQNVSCVVDGVSTGTKNVAQSKITGIITKTGQTTVCTFSNTGQLSGDVTYTITVANLTAEPVSLFSLNDDKFGNLSGVGNCATGGTIGGNLSYTCSFTKTLTGAAGTTHTNTVTAVAKDDEQNPVTKTGSATVSFVSPP
jgi:hypothetical protein